MSGKVKKLFHLENFIFQEFSSIDKNLIEINLQQLYKDYSANAKESLPYIKLISQRDKSGVQKDIQNILAK